MPGRRTVCAVAERSRISIHSASAFHTATCSNASRSKSAPSSAFSTASTFLLNAAVTPDSSSYAATSVAGSLTRSVPSRKKSPGRIRSLTRARKAARCPGSRFPIVLPRKATSLGAGAAPSAGNPSRSSKSDTTARTSSPGYSADSAFPAADSAGSLTSTGT